MAKIQNSGLGIEFVKAYNKQLTYNKGSLFSIISYTYFTFQNIFFYLVNSLGTELCFHNILLQKVFLQRQLNVVTLLKSVLGFKKDYSFRKYVFKQD